MNWQNWIIAAMLAVAFLDRICTMFVGQRNTDHRHVIALVISIAWYATFIGVLHSGGFW